MSSIRFSPIAEQVRLHRTYEMMKKIGHRDTIIQRFRGPAHFILLFSPR